MSRNPPTWLLRHAPACEGALAAGLVLLLSAVTALVVLDPATWPLALTVLLVSGQVLPLLCVRVIRRRFREQQLSTVSAGMVDEVERWLATGPRT